MPIIPELRLDREDLKPLNTLTRKARFAVAKALTKTAKDVQAGLKSEAPRVFHLRNTWVPQGIRIEPATSATLNAKVGSIDKYMARHVVGEKKRAAKPLSIRKNRDEDGRLATGGLLVAPYGSISSAPTHNVVRRRLNRIRGQKRKTFQIMGRGQGKILLVRRTSKKRNPLQVLAVLYNDANEIVRWRMDQSVERTVLARFGAHFEAAVSIE